MATLFIPALSWTFGTGNYNLAARSLDIPNGAKLGAFSVKNNSESVLYLDKGGYGNQPEYALLVVSVLNSVDGLLGYVALTQIVATDNPSYSLPNVNLTIDGTQASQGTFSNNSMPTVINGGGGNSSGGGSSGSSSCNCTAELSALESRIATLEGNQAITGISNLLAELRAEKNNILSSVQSQINSLGQRISNEGINSPNFVQKLFSSLSENKPKLALIVGGLLIGGTELSSFFGEERTKVLGELDKLRELQRTVQKSDGDFKLLKNSLDYQIKKQTANLNVLDGKIRGEIVKVERLTGQIDKVDDLAEGFADVTKRLDFQGKLINTTARTAETGLATANAAKSTAISASSSAAAAGATAASAGGLAAAAMGFATKLLGALGAIGGAAGLLALYGYFKAVKPTLDSHESRLDDHDKGFSQVYGSIQKVDNRARAAQSTANAAATEAHEANDRSRTAITKADQAIAKSNTAINIATETDRELEEYKLEQNKMNEEQFRQLKGEHGQIVNLITNLPAKFKEPPPIPAELLAIPVLIAGQAQQLTRIERTAQGTAAQTTAAEQVRNSATGTCQTMQPGGCGDVAIARHINPVRQILDWIARYLQGIGAALSGINVGLNLQILGAVNNLTVQTAQYQAKLLENFAKTWEFLKIDRVLNVLSTAASIHNASMLSFNVIQSLGETISSMLSIIGLKDADGNPFNIGAVLKSSATGMINNVLGAEAAAGISERWNKLNRIITAGSAVVMAVRSVQWAIAEGVEIIGGWIAHIGNGLRESGTVPDRQYPWMDAGIKIKNFSKLDKWNEGLESAENITNQVYATVSAGQEIAETVGSVRQAKTAFDSEFATKTTEADTALTNRETESQSPDMDNLDLIKIEEI